MTPVEDSAARAWARGVLQHLTLHNSWNELEDELTRAAEPLFAGLKQRDYFVQKAKEYEAEIERLTDAVMGGS